MVTENTAGILNSGQVGTENTAGILDSGRSVVQNTCRIGSHGGSVVVNTDVLRVLRPLRSSKYEDVWGTSGNQRFPFFVRQGRGATAYAPLDVPGKGTNAVFGLCRWVIYWGRPGPAVPVCGAYAIRPYPAGRLFSSKWVGAYCIRPIRRSRQGDGCKTCIRHRRWRLKGVCDTPLPIRTKNGNRRAVPLQNLRQKKNPGGAGVH